MPVKFQFAGTLPDSAAPDFKTGVMWLLDQTSGHPLNAVACDPDSSWMVERHLAGLGERPNLEVAREGDYSSVKNARTYRPVINPETGAPAKLNADDVSMQRVEQLRADLSTFRQMRMADSRLAGLRYQCSVPSPLDLTLFTFARVPYDPDRRMPRLLQALPGIPDAVRALKHLDAYCEAQRRDVAALCEDGGHKDIVFNLESPAILVALDLAPRPLRKLVARLLARQLADFIDSLPDEARVRLHLCNSNHQDKALFHPKNLRNPVMFLNLLAHELRRRKRALPEVDIPAAVSGEAPSTDPAYYKDLENLDEGYAVVAGVIAEGHRAASITAYWLFRTALGRSVKAIMTACGLGRHSEEDAREAIKVMITVANAANAAASGTAA